MTDKQRILLNTLLDHLDMKNKHHRTNLVRRLALNKYRTIEEIPTDFMSAIIGEIYSLLAEPDTRGEKNESRTTK